MTEERHNIRIDVDGNAAEEIKDVGDASTKAGKQVDGLQKSSKKLGVSMEALRNVALAVVAVIAKGIKVFGEQQAAAGRLERAYRKAGQSAQDYARAQAIVNQSQNEFGVRTAEGLDAMQRLIAVTGDAAQAERDYALALDISSQENISLEAATESLVRARKGEFEELKNLSTISKTFTERLSQMEDRTVAAEVAVERLSEAYTGAAKENAGLEEKQKSLMTEVENTTGAIGDATIAVLDMTFAMLGLSSTNSVLEDIQRGFKGLASEARVAASNIELFVKGAGSILVGNERTAESEYLRAQAEEALFSGRLGDFMGFGIASGVAQGAGPTSQGGPNRPANAPPPAMNFGVEDGMFVGFDSGGKGRSGGGRRGGGEGGMAITEDEVNAFNRLTEMDQKRLEIAKEEDELKRAKLELELRILEIKDQQLEAGREQNEIEIARAESAREVKAIEEERTNRFVEKQKQELDAVLAKHEAIRNQERKTAEEQQEYIAGLIAARDQQNQAAIQGIQGAAQAATGFIKNERTRAAIRGAMEAAEAIAAGAAGNIPGAIAHGAAAAQFFAVAGQGGSGQSGSQGTTAAARGRRVSADAGAQRAGQVGGQPTNTTVQYVFNSGFAPSPRDARMLANETERARRNGAAGEVR